MSSFLSQLGWRRAIKSFDPDADVSDADLTKILNAIRMAPTSFGLQPFEVHVLKNKALREKLLQHSWNQPQIIACSVLLTFVVRIDIKKRIDEYFSLLSEGDSEMLAKLKDYELMMRSSLENRNTKVLTAWASKQAYIAVGFAMAACAELQIDSCPMEGILGPEYDRLLGLPADKHTVIVLPLGYRNKNVPLTPSFRFPESDLFKRDK